MRVRITLGSPFMPAPGRIKKDTLLGMPIGTAANRLRKAIMFSMAKRLGEHFCHRCGTEIETAEALSIEHKDAWQSAADPVAAFFDIGNISFSHHSCNSGAASRPNKKYKTAKERWTAKNHSPRGKAAKQRWNIKRSQERLRRRSAVDSAASSYLAGREFKSPRRPHNTDGWPRG